MHPSNAKNWAEVVEYAKSICDGRKIACVELKQAVDRFFRDLENLDYWMDYKAPEFCIQIIEKTLCHQQGERLDGTPLRGEPFRLEPYQKFIIYNLVGFKITGTNNVRFHEAPAEEWKDRTCRCTGLGAVSSVPEKRRKNLYCICCTHAVSGKFQFPEIQR